MAYLGNTLQVAFPSYRNIDDISGSFNGVTTTFPLRVSGVAPVPFPINSNQCLISVGGVIQRPDDSGTEGFRISGTNIIFSSAPAGAADFFGVILAGADYVNVGATFPSGSATVPSITFDSDLDTGIYNPNPNELGFTTAGTARLILDSNGQLRVNSLGSAAAPVITFNSDPNTGIYSPGADQVAISSSGSERIRIGANGEIGLSGANYGTSGQVLTSAGSGAAPTWTTVGAVLYNRRPALYRGSLFYKTAATTISIVAGAVLNGHLYGSATAVTMPGSFTNNTDYAIWQHPTTAALVADASFTTAPAGATGGSVVGGFHYIPSGRPTGFNNGSPTSAAEILEFSLWDLTYRPSCADPRGMACIEGGFWMDLYLCGATSYAGSTFSAVPSSGIGLTIADSSSPPLVPAQYGGNGSTTYSNGKWYVFTEVARSFGKRLPTYDEFSAAAFGAPEASGRGTDPGTVQWERVSKFGLAQATGTLWVWGQENCTSDPPAAFTTGTETEGRGQHYGSQSRAIVLGGAWSNASACGSRSAAWDNSPWSFGSNRGARFCCNHLVSG